MNFSLTLAGDIDKGNPGSVSGAWMKESFDSRYCEWIGYKENIIDLFEKVDIVILPSYYREGIPHCLIEALAAGKPIITTDMPGCREVIHENGIMIPPKNSNALFNAMLEIVQKDNLQYWGKNSSKLASKFDIHDVNQKTLSVYGVST